MENDVETIKKDFNVAEKMYNSMSKESLVKLLLLRDTLDLQLTSNGNSTELWYYVADETGCKYITDKMPEQVFIEDKSAFAGLYITSGEVNIRIPRYLEHLFPEIEYGDGPVKINLTIS